jgi:hypothetical protein
MSNFSNFPSCSHQIKGKKPPITRIEQALYLGRIRTTNLPVLSSNPVGFNERRKTWWGR